MNSIDDYAAWTEEMWFASGGLEISEHDITVMSLGLAGETGEVMELLKKRVRDGAFDVGKFRQEMGDVMYYWCRLCRAFGLHPSEVLAANVVKLNDRRARKVMRGSGDNR